FNNLLTVINGSAELLRNALPPVGEPADLLAGITTAGAKAAALTERLLRLSRHRPAALGPADLNAALSDVELLLSRTLGRKIKVVLELAPSLPKIRGEEGLLHQIVLNLALNARDAMASGGVLTLRTELVSPDRVRLRVSDTGAGMDEALMERVFEPFFTTKHGVGTGLGLATVYSSVQQLGGEIRLDSRPGHGTEFQVDFLVADESQSSPGRRRIKSRRAVSDAVLLLVDDDDAVRGLMRRILASAGHLVLDAAGPAAALKIAAEYAGPIHLLVTDIVMPEMTGRELAVQLQNRRPEVRVLFVSGYAPETVLEGDNLTIRDAFVQKPPAPQTLLEKVSELLQATPSSWQ
ncbi:MAG TPA: ATP-binding protein, partial [Planctomycetia bacterium]|nr:ATP-binding protein [Planctomycetia bacterium]